MRTPLAALVVCTALAAASFPTAVAAQDLPAATSSADALAPLAPMIGKTWRGRSVAQDDVEDIMRWEWAVGGHAVRVTHAINNGVYGGETLIFPDRDSGDLVFHYFTTGGFHTTGTIRPAPDGALTFDETVHGANGIETLKTHAVLAADGIYRTRSQTQRAGRWVDFGGFDYRQDPEATVWLSMRPGIESPASAGPMDLTRRIVARPTTPGEAVAGYLRIRNGAPVADQLIAVACTCAERIEFHQIRRQAAGVSMDTDPTWEVPGHGMLDIRPGSDLHLMLLDFAPSAVRDGAVRLTLTFRDAGKVVTDFAVTADTRAAWEAFQ